MTVKAVAGQNEPVPRWADVAVAAPDLAVAVRARFEATGLALLATLRRDGSPRLSGIEPLFALDELWLGMMDGSRKQLDLLRDPRLALHSATTDKQVAEGDAKIGGRAIAVHDAPTFAAYKAQFEAENQPVAEGAFPLFRVDVLELSFLRPAGDHLDISWWRPDCGLRRHARF